MADKDPDTQPPDLPDAATDACARFATDHVRLMSFVGFVSGLALRADEVRRIAAEALAGGDRIAGREVEEYEIDENTTAVRALQRHREVLLEMAYTRGVDNFLTYISELLALVYGERPETLHAKGEPKRGGTAETVPLDTILEHSTMEDLIASLVERRVTDLSFKGLRALATYLSERLGFDLFEDEDDLRRAIRVVEIRNLIAHNRAVVNRVFLNRIEETEGFPLGRRVDLDVDRLFGDLSFLARSTFAIDTRAGEKWALPLRALSGRSEDATADAL
jgi:hypothetical protein